MAAHHWAYMILSLVAWLSLHAKVHAVDTAATNVTVKLLSPTAAVVNWNVSGTWQRQKSNGTHLIRWEITYKPMHDRQRITIAIPSEWTSYQLKDLRPDTIYSITVTSVTRNRRTKSSPVHLAVPPLIESGRIGHSAIYNSNIYLTPLPNATVAGSINVRGEEVGIVVLVLAVWVAAISLFFHRWGKIRMLLPYQPVFKEEDHVMAPPTPPQVQQQRSISSTGCKVPFNSAEMRRHQYMQRGRNGWPTSMSRLSDSLIIGRSHQAAVHSSSVYQRANTVPGCGYAFAAAAGGGSTIDGCSECGSSGANTPRKALSAEVITLTVTDCGEEEAGPSQPITEQESIQEECEEAEPTTSHPCLRRQDGAEMS